MVTKLDALNVITQVSTMTCGYQPTPLLERFVGENSENLCSHSQTPYELNYYS